MTHYADSTFSFMATIAVADLPNAIRNLPPHCGHHVMDNGDGTVVLSAWSSNGNAH